jgi:hypothetical protein
VKRRVLMTARLIVPPQDLKHGSDHKFSGPRRERAVDHLGVKTAQILADERPGDYLLAEFGEEPIDSGLSLWMGSDAPPSGSQLDPAGSTSSIAPTGVASSAGYQTACLTRRSLSRWLPSCASVSRTDFRNRRPLNESAAISTRQYAEMR